MRKLELSTLSALLLLSAAFDLFAFLLSRHPTSSAPHSRLPLLGLRAIVTVCKPHLRCSDASSSRQQHQRHLPASLVPLSSNFYYGLTRCSLLLHSMSFCWFCVFFFITSLLFVFVFVSLKKRRIDNKTVSTTKVRRHICQTKHSNVGNDRVKTSSASAATVLCKIFWENLFNSNDFLNCGCL